MKLLQNESLITRSANGAVSLTTHRLRHHLKLDGSDYLISMVLDQVASIEMSSKRRSIFWKIAVACFLIGLYLLGENASEIALFFAALGIVFLISYFFSRSYQLAFTSAGSTSLAFKIKGMKNQEVMDFIEQVEQAILLYPNLKVQSI